MFNDDHLEKRHNELFGLILKNKSDIVCLQEVRADMVDIFIHIFAEVYYPAVEELKPPGRTYGEMIFIKKGIVLGSYKYLEFEGKMGRSIQHARVKKDKVQYNVITFHLESMNCKKIRRNQLAKIWKHVEGLENVICCGDTNQTLKETLSEEYIIPDNFSDVWEQTDREIGEYTYYSGRFWDADRKQRYDKIWISDNLYLAGFGVLGHQPIEEGVWISDHDGLYCLVGKKN